MAALAVSWLLLGAAYSGAFVIHEIRDAGHDAAWLVDAIYVWFYGFGFPALFSLVAVFFLGIYRLARWSEYRYSWYGWVWLVLTWLNMCGLTALH